MKTTTLLILTAIILAVPISSTSSQAAPVYVCPDCNQACDKLKFDKPGPCPGCGMTLIEFKEQEKSKPISVAILLFDGAEIIDYAGPWEAFGDAGFKVFSVAESLRPVKATFGQTITPDYTFANSPNADILLVPGGGGIRGAVQNTRLIEWVKKNERTSSHVMSVCSGAFILARAGLLDGLSATTVSHRLEQLAEAAPKTLVVHDQRYVDNGKIITTAGLSSGIDGAFHVIAKVKGKGTAQLAALGMEYRWDADSKYARAALADRYFPEISGIDADVLSTQGDTNQWEFRALVSKPASPEEIIDLLGKRIVSNTPHTHGSVALASPAQSAGGPRRIEWQFTDDQDGVWAGVCTVESAPDQAGKFLVTLKLQRKPQEKAT